MKRNAFAQNDFFCFLFIAVFTLGGYRREMSNASPLSALLRPLANYVRQMDRHFLAAIGFMLGSMAWFSVMNIFIRMMTFEMDTMQIVFLRNVCSTLILLPWVAYNGFQIIRTNRITSHFWRSGLGVIGMQAWFYAISLMPLNDATALSFIAPILGAVLAILVLKERAGWHRWSAIIVGFIGAMIIIQPGSNGGLVWESLIVIFAAFFWAAAGILVKSLSQTEPTTRIVFYMSVFMMLMAAPPMFWVWQTPTWEQMAIIFAIAVASTGAHVCLVNAYARADVVALMPFDFSRLIFTAILTWLVFDESSGINVWIGAAIIISSAIYIAHREALKKRINTRHCEE